MGVDARTGLVMLKCLPTCMTCLTVTTCVQMMLSTCVLQLFFTDMCIYLPYVSMERYIVWSLFCCRFLSVRFSISCIWSAWNFSCWQVLENVH